MKSFVRITLAVLFAMCIILHIVNKAEFDFAFYGGLELLCLCWMLLLFLLALTLFVVAASKPSISFSLRMTGLWLAAAFLGLVSVLSCSWK